MSALSVLLLILPFPLAFIIHDGEEVMFQHRWMLKHKDVLCKRLPMAKRMFERLSHLSTKAFAIAAAEELLVLLAVTAYVLTDAPYALEIWAALFLAFSLHLAVHIGQGFIVRGYVPGIVSAILLLPYASYGVYSIRHSMSVTTFALCSIVGVVFMVINLMLAYLIFNMKFSKNAIQ